MENQRVKQFLRELWSNPVTESTTFLSILLTQLLLLIILGAQPKYLELPLADQQKVAVREQDLLQAVENNSNLSPQQRQFLHTVALLDSFPEKYFDRAVKELESLGMQKLVLFQELSNEEVIFWYKDSQTPLTCFVSNQYYNITNFPDFPDLAPLQKEAAKCDFPQVDAHLAGAKTVGILIESKVMSMTSLGKWLLRSGALRVWPNHYPNSLLYFFWRGPRDADVVENLDLKAIGFNQVDPSPIVLEKADGNRANCWFDDKDICPRDMK
jgi:hypothetical protein